MKQKKPLIELQQVSFSYTVGGRQKIPVFRDISLSIYPGEYVAIIGHNGSGKSTLMQHFNGLSIPQTGMVVIDGVNLSNPKVDRKAVRRKVGLAQRPAQGQDAGRQCSHKSVADDKVSQ